jgi:hypothetical protein
MKRLLVSCVLVGCQTSAAPSGNDTPKPKPAPPPGPVDAAYARDITNLCNAVTRAPGVDTATGKNDRQIVIAMWLGKVLETQASRDWLAEIQPLQGPEKADALDAEAKRVGLAGCALSAEWR